MTQTCICILFIFIMFCGKTQHTYVYYVLYIHLFIYLFYQCFMVIHTPHIYILHLSLTDICIYRLIYLISIHLFVNFNHCSMVIPAIGVVYLSVVCFDGSSSTQSFDALLTGPGIFYCHLKQIIFNYISMKKAVVVRLKQALMRGWKV